jgi:hypothetical protein
MPGASAAGSLSHRLAWPVARQNARRRASRPGARRPARAGSVIIRVESESAGAGRPSPTRSPAAACATAGPAAPLRPSPAAGPGPGWRSGCAGPAGPVRGPVRSSDCQSPGPVFAESPMIVTRCNSLSVCQAAQTGRRAGATGPARGWPRVRGQPLRDAMIGSSGDHDDHHGIIIQSKLNHPGRCQ